MTHVTRTVLREMRVQGEKNGGESTGFSVIQALKKRGEGLSTGSVYPVLERLMKAGWATERWESDGELASRRSGELVRRNRRGDKGSRRHYFKLTDDALRAMKELEL